MMTPEQIAKHTQFSDWLVAGKKAKEPIEWEWFVRKAYLDGNHWIRWNPASKSIEGVNSGDKWKTTINETYRIVRAVRNYVTKYDPKWEVTAMDAERRVYNKAVGSERLLDTYFMEEKFGIRVKETVGDALYASVGHVWFWWDAAVQWLRCMAVNPFEFIPDPTAKDYLAYSDAKFVARAYSQKEADLKADERFMNREEVIADNKISSSDMRTTLLQLSPGVNQNAWTDNKDLETTMCYELYYRTKELNEKGGNIWHAIVTPTTLLLDEPTRFLGDMPARTYHTDIETGQQYTQGWVKNLIAPQKIIDQNESSTLEYNHIFSKGRYVTDKDSGVGVIVNQNGQVITKNRGSYFEQLTTQPQPLTVERQTQRALLYMENIGAAHDAFMGRLPTGAESGKAIEALMLGEENNLGDLRTNFDDFMVSSGEFILRAFSRHRVDVRVIFSDNPEHPDEPDVSAVVGDSSPLKEEEVEVMYNGTKKKVKVERIIEKNNVRVTVGTWIGSGKLGSQDTLFKMAEAGIVDTQTILENYNAPNIPRILDRLSKQKANEAMMQAAVTQPPGTMPAIDMGMGANGNQPGGGLGTGGTPEGAPAVPGSTPAR